MMLFFTLLDDQLPQWNMAVRRAAIFPLVLCTVRLSQCDEQLFI